MERQQNDDYSDLTPDDVEIIEDSAEERAEAPRPEAPEEDEAVTLREELGEAREKFLRLYAEFENYKKRAQKDRDDLLGYSHEALLGDLLPTIDNLEAALKHSGDASQDALVKGVEATHRELMRTVERFGLKPIEALMRPFDPTFHHAVSQAERADVEEGIVVEEYRKGYMFKDRVLRAPLVVVSKKPSQE